MKPSLSDTLLVFCGGGLGATLRAVLTALFPNPAPGLTVNGGPLESLPVTILVINCLGALLLGALTGISKSYPATPSRRWIQLSLGTGMMGGFTTYSSFALAIAQFGLAGQWATALIYLLLSLAGGYLLAWAGLNWGAKTATAYQQRAQGGRKPS